MNIYLMYIIFAVILVLLICFHLKRIKFYKCAYSLPGPFAWPILGNALHCIGTSEDLIKTIIKLINIYGSPFRFWLGSKFVVVISKPKDIEIVLNSCAQKEESVMGFLRPFVGNGLITAHAAEWKIHRKLINPAFNQKILNSFIPSFVEHSNILIENLNSQVGKKEFDIYKFISLNTLDFLCDTTMGIKINAQNKQSEYAEILHRILTTAFGRMMHIWSHFDAIFYKLPKGKQFLKDVKLAHKFAEMVFEEKKREIGSESLTKNEDVEEFRRKAFLEHLLELQNNDNLNEKQIFDEVNTFMAAGTDTMSSVISFVCMLLGSHEEIQEQVYNEITEVLNDSNNEITYNTLQQLQYLERIIKETMRLFPAAPLLIRANTRDIKLDSCVIPENSAILYPIIHTHRDPEFWPEPFIFNPDRFLPENITTRHAYSYLPFGGGLRNCIGFRYSTIAMKVVLTILIQNYKFVTNFKIETLRLETNIVLKPVLGHLVQLESRK